jgi:hypothetical protein
MAHPSIVGLFQVQKSRRTGERYYFNPVTGASAWHDDALPAGWAWGKDAEASPRFYVNLLTGNRVNELPTAAASGGAVTAAPLSAAPDRSSAPQVPASSG